nr:peptidoglycan-binding domain-containing protein [uncultured Cohaesibacter sp.]
MTSTIVKTAILLSTLVPVSLVATYAFSASNTIEVATAEQARLQWEGEGSTAQQGETEDDLTQWEKDFSHWQRVQEHDNIQEYKYYLRAFPNGEFADIARSRIDILMAEQRADDHSRLVRVQRASEVDEDAFITPSEAIEIEARLAAIGYDIGRVDGEFKQNTRDAIKDWQETNGLPNNGFLNWTQYNLLCRNTEEQFIQWRNDNPSVKIMEAQSTN